MEHDNVPDNAGHWDKAVVTRRHADRGQCSKNHTQLVRRRQQRARAVEHAAGGHEDRRAAHERAAARGHDLVRHHLSHENGCARGHRRRRRR